MWKISKVLFSARAAGLYAFLTGMVLAGGVLGQPSGVDPQAERLLQTATTYLADQKRFSVEARGTIEVVLDSGQKIQFDHTAILSMQRPDKLLAERHGELVDQIFYYDGKSLTLYNPDEKYYATLPAPDTLEKMLDFAREELDIVAPAGDLLYSDAFELLMQEVTSGFVVGKSVLDGVPCIHLAFRAPHIDWQIWIQQGDQPLPRKFVITSTDVAGAPQFMVVMRQWNIAPDFADKVFQFTPPADTKQIEFLPAQAGAASSR